MIGEGIMHLEIDGRVVATATERVGGWWEVTRWPTITLAVARVPGDTDPD